MRIRAGFRISYQCDQPQPIIVMLNVHPSLDARLCTPDILRVDCELDLRQYVDGFGNVCTRTVLPAGLTTFSSDFAIEDTGLPDEVAFDARQTAVEDLPEQALVYLLGSRYCETDRMVDLAWSLFGETPRGWPRVQAIINYTHDRIAFNYAHASATRTAFEANEERIGVCRDYAHLAITLCRCMNIPARYCTGYLGDIGVAPMDYPMDFSAWIEAFLDGEWRTFDARHNTPRIGRILMARGRDATDVALSTTFGATRLSGFEVTTYELAEP